MLVLEDEFVHVGAVPDVVLSRFAAAVNEEPEKLLYTVTPEGVPPKKFICCTITSTVPPMVSATPGCVVEAVPFVMVPKPPEPPESSVNEVPVVENSR